MLTQLGVTAGYLLALASRSRWVIDQGLHVKPMLIHLGVQNTDGAAYLQTTVDA
jgi:hypothetical protein